MADTGRTDPFADVISLVAGPIAAVIRSFDQLRRGAEDLVKGFEHFNATMSTLDETAQRVGRLLAEVEEPVRTIVPQVVRTVQLADEMATRLAGPVDQVIPGISRLAETLESPVLRTLPADLGQFVDTMGDLARRMSPLAQIAEQAGGLFGLRMPGAAPAPTPAAAPTPPATAPAPPATPAADEQAPVPPAPEAATATTPAAPPARKAPAKRAPGTRTTGTGDAAPRASATKAAKRPPSAPRRGAGS